MNNKIFVFIWEENSISEIHTIKTFTKKYNKKSNLELYEKSNFTYSKKSKNIINDIFKNWNNSYNEIRNYDNMKVINLNY